jgi:hypothetical protein
MQNEVFHIDDNLQGADQLDAWFSFDGFIHYLRAQRLHEKSMRAKFLDFVINYFEQRLNKRHLIEEGAIGQYGDLLDLVHASVFPPVEDEGPSVWAMGIPLTPAVVYGTDAFYDMLRDPVTRERKASLVEDGYRIRKTMNFALIYSTILKQLYGFHFAVSKTMIRSLAQKDTGLVSFYRLNIDQRFIEVVSKGALPAFDESFFQNRPTEEEAIAWLQERLPMSAFRFEGFASITIEDVTTQYVLDSIKDLVVTGESVNDRADHSEVIRYLNILARSNEVQFGLLPLLKVNDRPVYLAESCHHSVLASVATDKAETEEAYLCLIEHYFGKPGLMLYEDLMEKETDEYFFLGLLRRAGIRSYALMPVYYNGRLAGVLEASSRRPGILSRDLLTRIEVVIPLLAQLLQRETEEFDMGIKDFVKENFTSIQPAVEWKFHEAAWHFLRDQAKGEIPPTVETIYFKQVYPLYGAIDIRDSTLERNGALRRDLQTQFRVLNKTLSSLPPLSNVRNPGPLLQQVGKWEEALTGALTTADEMNLNNFLREDLGSWLVQAKQGNPDVAVLIAPYLNATDEVGGEAFARRRGLEASFQSINKAINTHLEQTMAELQRSYPFYFEKFRTDGVEYDVYVGQSMAPDRPFDLSRVQELRFRQVRSMAEIARLTRGLLPQLPEPLHTTQLIFVHSTPIDISFRMDERRFDVEGAYNIRYQVVKKRIDKVRVRETGERLTQPDKIAIIYFSDRGAGEYGEYIARLQEEGLLEEEIERLDLEDVQGVTGLRALRVTVKT